MGCFQAKTRHETRNECFYLQSPQQQFLSNFARQLPIDSGLGVSGGGGGTGGLCVTPSIAGCSRRWSSRSTPFSSLAPVAPSSSASVGSCKGSASARSSHGPIITTIGSTCSLIASSRFFLCLCLGLFGLGITVKVEIDHDIPLDIARSNGATETQYLAGQQPPDQTNGVAGLVVAWNSNVDVFGGRVGVDEGNNWNINIGSFANSLGVGARVGNNNQARLLKRAGNVIGKVAGCKTTSNGS
jgi:hypothetical protein